MPAKKTFCFLSPGMQGLPLPTYNHPVPCGGRFNYWRLPFLRVENHVQMQHKSGCRGTSYAKVQSEGKWGKCSTHCTHPSPTFMRWTERGYAEVQSKGKQGGCSTHHPHPSFAFITNSEHGAMCFLRSSNLPLNLLSEPILSHLINHFIFFMILFWITPPLISQKVHYFIGYEGFLLLSCSSFNQFACLPLSC